MTTPLHTDDPTIAVWSTETPVGPLTVLAADGAVVAAGFCPADDLWSRLPERRRRPLEPTADLGAISRAVDAYLTGDVTALDEIPVAQDGTELQREVWTGLRTIPAGETRTYTELAADTSRPRAVRAAGTSCGRNLIAPIVPCHRALRSDGSLGGYYYGLEIKRWLLDHESQKYQESQEYQEKATTGR